MLAEERVLVAAAERAEMTMVEGRPGPVGLTAWVDVVPVAFVAVG